MGCGIDSERRRLAEPARLHPFVPPSVYRSSTGSKHQNTFIFSRLVIFATESVVSFMYSESHQLAPLARSGRVLPTRRDLASGIDREALRASSQPNIYTVSIHFVQVASTNSSNGLLAWPPFLPGASRRNLPWRNKHGS